MLHEKIHQKSGIFHPKVPTGPILSPSRATPSGDPVRIAKRIAAENPRHVASSWRMLESCNSNHQKCSNPTKITKSWMNLVKSRSNRCNTCSTCKMFCFFSGGALWRWGLKQICCISSGISTPKVRKSCTVHIATAPQKKWPTSLAQSLDFCWSFPPMSSKLENQPWLHD